MNDEVKGKSVVLTTTNGTQAIAVARNAYKVVVGSFLNIDVLCNWLKEQGRDVVLLCAGWKNRFNIEDTMFAGAVVKELLASGKFNCMCDSAVASQFLFERAKNDMFAFLETSSHRRRLEKLKLEKDIRYCLTANSAPVIPILQGDSLVKIK